MGASTISPQTALRNAGLARAMGGGARAAIAACLIVLGAVATGCSSEPTPQPNVPVAGGGTVGNGDLSGTPKPGQQWTTNDAPSSGDVDQNRPKMNAAASSSYESGVKAFMSGDLATAKKLFTDATNADPKAYQAYYSLGVVLERLKDDGAAAAYRQSYTVLPSYEPGIIAFGVYKAKKSQLSDADSFLTQKKGEMPKSAAITAALAEVKSLEKNTGDAQKLAQEALKINPDYRPAMVVIARDHYRNRRLDLALYALQAILDGFEPVSENPPRDKGNPEALLLRGLIYKEQGNRPGAIDQFTKALAVRPDLVEGRVQLATFLLEAGDATQAQPLLEGALRFDLENVAAQLLLGDCYRLQGRYADAKTRFDYVAGKDSSMPMVHYDLALLYLFAPSFPGLTPMQQIDNATAELKKYQELRDKNVTDDSDELLQRAKLKRGELEAQAAAASAPAPAIPPAGGAKPGDKPAPAGGDKPAPAGGDKPAPAGGDKPAPAGGDKPAPAGGDKPTPGPGN
jgi:tetratricopeptide (TPR) repeat protein